MQVLFQLHKRYPQAKIGGVEVALDQSLGNCCERQFADLILRKT